MRERRKELGLTQEQMAETLNVSVKHYGGVERGDAGLSLENLVELCKILSVSLDYLVFGEPDVPNDTATSVPTRLYDIFSASSKAKQRKLLEILELINAL